jgi:hypothetical protein
MLRAPFLAAVLVVLVAVLALGRGSAATPTAAAPGFSPFVAPRAYVRGDCRIRVGPAFDVARAGRTDWRAIGAARVDCARRHERIAISVREVRAGEGPPVVVAGADRQTAGRASTGFVPTGPACRDGAVARWQTRVAVTLDGRSSGWLGDAWSSARADGCGP